MTDDQLRAEFARHRASLDALVAGLAQMNETLATHSSMLKALMVAAAPDDDGSPLQEVLVRIAQGIEQNGGAIEHLAATVEKAGKGNA